MKPKLIQDWKNWWSRLSSFQKLWPTLLVLIYWAIYGFGGILKTENFILGGILILSSSLGPFFRKIFLFSLPLALNAMVYQTQSLYVEVLRGDIHVSEPYFFDLDFFGIETAAGRLTLNEWWQLHTHPILDFITGFSYITYILNFVLIFGFFHFWKSRDPLRGKIYERESLRMMWACLWANLIGYTTYFWYAAAPPWYVSKFGFGPANPNAAPDPAGALRFDELVGIDFFSNFYSKSANVFGAVPSLHIVYPLCAMYLAFRLRGLRIYATLNFLIVCFAAIYLNHHYLLDVLWGAVYGFGVCAAMDWWARSRNSFEANPPLAKPGKFA